MSQNFKYQANFFLETYVFIENFFVMSNCMAFQAHT